MQQKTIDQWVNLYADELYRWAIIRVKDAHEAEDLVQDTFLAAYQAIDQFKAESHPKTWLIGILKLKVMDYYRRSGSAHRPRPLDNDQDWEAAFFDQKGDWQKTQSNALPWHSAPHLLDDSEFLSTLKNCLEHLPSRLSGALSAKYLLGLAAKETCQELGVTPSNYWQLIRRGKLSLKKCLEKNWFHQTQRRP